MQGHGAADGQTGGIPTGNPVHAAMDLRYDSGLSTLRFDLCREMIVE